VGFCIVFDLILSGDKVRQNSFCKDEGSNFAQDFYGYTF
jgi:hypothetical protein